MGVSTMAFDVCHIALLYLVYTKGKSLQISYTFSMGVDRGLIQVNLFVV